MLAALGAVAAPAWGQFRLDVSGVGATQQPLAIAAFRDEDKAGLAVSQILRADLERSGLFRVLGAPGGLDELARPDYAALRAQGADALVAGSVQRLADG
ncbi:MAG: Tol-Pal system protein TolB, partial [Comamonadaceae bacterium]|nr:Tol-Pal system protein TolB [Comamonadaceae bacterium]